MNSFFENLSAIENIGNDEYDIPAETCMLEEDDIQMGCIFLNETSRMLKFRCKFCRCIYDNINYYCDHIAEHVNLAERPEDLRVTPSPLSAAIVDIKTDDEEIDARILESMIEEEPDEADEIAAEVAQEMLALRNANGYAEEMSNCSDFFGYNEDSKNELPEVNERPILANNTVKTDQLDFENLIDLYAQLPTVSKGEGPMAHLSQSTIQRQKKKKVVTVKVIAARNRMAEIYAEIKLEEEKRSNAKEQYEALHEREPPPAEKFEEISSTDIQNPPPASSVTAPTAPEINRQIIGETVITLLPNGNLPAVPTAPLSSSTNDDALALSGALSGRVRREKELTCPACGKWFHSSYRLSVHKRSHYLESNNRIKLAHRCSDCDSLFNTANEMKDHLRQIHYPDGFICKICGKKLSTLILLETHARKVHLKRPFNCKICLKNYDNRELYEDHVRSHFITTRTFRCHICGRKYPTEIMLKYHLNRHQERKPQCCVVCGKMTLRITQHMKIHVPRPKRVLLCTICGKSFNFSSGLSTHFRNFHKLPVNTSEEAAATENAANASNIRSKKEKKDTKPSPGPVTRSRKKSINEYSKKEQTLKQLQLQQQQQYDAEIIHKEEEAKRVIVELIQNVTYSSFLPENFVSGDDEAPPIAREETITAVNSIAHE